MIDILGEEWFQRIFLPNCGPERPQLLLLDSHSSHEVIGLIEKARQQNIHLFTFPPHTTHYLQPLDRSCFGPLSTAYNQYCSEFLAKNPNNEISKKTFPSIFYKSWQKALTPSNIKAGFSATGIYPFNPSAFIRKAPSLHLYPLTNFIRLNLLLCHLCPICVSSSFRIYTSCYSCVSSAVSATSF